MPSDSLTIAVAALHRVRMLSPVRSEIAVVCGEALALISAPAAVSSHWHAEDCAFVGNAKRKCTCGFAPRGATDEPKPASGPYAAPSAERAVNAAESKRLLALADPPPIECVADLIYRAGWRPSADAQFQHLANALTELQQLFFVPAMAAHIARLEKEIEGRG